MLIPLLPCCTSLYQSDVIAESRFKKLIDELLSVGQCSAPEKDAETPPTAVAECSEILTPGQRERIVS